MQAPTVFTPLLIVALLMPQASALPDSAHKLTEQEEADSYAIYSMLLKKDFSQPQSPIWGIREETFIRQSGQPSPVWPEPAPNQRAIYQPLIEDFKRQNSRPLLLERKFDLPAYRLVNAHEASEITKRHGFVPPPPGAPWPLEDSTLNDIYVVFSLSAVGFSPNHRLALVYIAGWYTGRYYFLVRKRGKWIIDKDYRGDAYHWIA